jgi:hypothetical protein
MKSIAKHLVVLLAMCTLTSVLALAKTTSKHVTFAQAVTVNDQIVKPGTYKVTFDDQTGELTITNGKKVVAKAPARLERADTRAVYITRTEEEKAVLLSIRLKDGNQAVIGDNSNSGAERMRN